VIFPSSHSTSTNESRSTNEEMSNNSLNMFSTSEYKMQNYSSNITHFSNFLEIENVGENYIIHQESLINFSVIAYQK